MFSSVYKPPFRFILRQIVNNRLTSLRKTHNAKDNDAPIKFSTSRAKSWKAEYTRRGIDENYVEHAWFESYVILGSLAVFLLYFCVFREENDIDEILDTSLYSRIDGLEELQLKAVLQYNLDHGKDTTQIVARLKEIADSK